MLYQVRPYVPFADCGGGPNRGAGRHAASGQNIFSRNPAPPRPSSPPCRWPQSASASSRAGCPGPRAGTSSARRSRRAGGRPLAAAPAGPGIPAGAMSPFPPRPARARAGPSARTLPRARLSPALLSAPPQPARRDPRARHRAHSARSASRHAAGRGEARVISRVDYESHCCSFTAVGRRYGLTCCPGQARGQAKAQ